MSAQANLAKTVDCSTAQADIETLNGEKARTSQEIEDGAGSIIPIGAVAHLFGGSEKESFEIGTGEYNKKLDAKIAEIKNQCNIKQGSVAGNRPAQAGASPPPLASGDALEPGSTCNGPGKPRRAAGR